MVTPFRLQAANLQLSDMDLVEINEAFAAQFLSCAKELGLDMDKSNVNGTRKEDSVVGRLDSIVLTAVHLERTRD
jgi:hypothetical protein